MKELTSKTFLVYTFLVDEVFLTHISSKATFHSVWQSIRQQSLDSWIRAIGYSTAIVWEVSRCEVDSSGFKVVT